jgi:hypothetical protein
MMRFRNLTSHVNLKQTFSNFLNVLEHSLKNSKTGEEKVIECKGVISSIPLGILLQQLTPAVPSILVERVKSLKFRNTAIAYLIVESGNLFPDRCIDINDANIRLGRVTNFANWSKDMVPNSHQTPFVANTGAILATRLGNSPKQRFWYRQSKI